MPIPATRRTALAAAVAAIALAQGAVLADTATAAPATPATPMAQALADAPARDGYWFASVPSNALVLVSHVLDSLADDTYF
jgi:hypothetical protein